MEIKPIEYKVWGEPPTVHNPEFCEVANLAIQFKTEDLCPPDDPFGKKTIAEVKHRVEAHPLLMKRLEMIKKFVTEEHYSTELLGVIDIAIKEGTVSQ